MFRKPKRKEWVFLLVVVVLYLSGVVYVVANNLSMDALFRYGLLQPKGISGEEGRVAEVSTPLSGNVLRVVWFIYIKGSAVLVELLPYWVVGMLIAAGLIVFVPWEKVRERMGWGGFGSNFLAATAGAIVPICSCGIVPVLAGMVEAGIPLGPTMAFLVAAPMLNVPAVFMTAGVLGWRLAVGRVIGTMVIAVGQFFSAWQGRVRFLRRFVKLSVTPSLSPELRRFAFAVGAKLAREPAGLPTGELSPGQEEKLYLLAEAGVLDRSGTGLWCLPDTSAAGPQSVGSCFTLPAGDGQADPRHRMRTLVSTAWDLFLQLSYYLVLAAAMAGAIKVLIPTSVILTLVGGRTLNSVVVAAFVAVLAYVCTYVEVPTALALVHKGMGGGAVLAYLLGGPGLSLPSFVLLSGVFKRRALAAYVGLSFVGCVLAGYVFNLF